MTFDPNKLRVRDRVTISFEITGFDSLPGHVEAIQLHRDGSRWRDTSIKVDHIVGYAPNYTPAPDPDIQAGDVVRFVCATDEWTVYAVDAKSTWLKRWGNSDKLAPISAIEFVRRAERD